MKNIPKDSPLLSSILFRRLLLLAIICFSAIWFIDQKSGIISPFDAVLYPVCTLAFLSIYVFSITNLIKDPSLHLATYLIVAGYLIGSSIWHHMATNGMFSNAAQWLGLNYVIAYLFLELKQAIVMTIVAFVATIVGHFLVLIHHYTLSDTLGVVLNIAVAHVVYIVLLWAVIKLRSSRDRAQQQANMLEHYAYIDPLTRILNRRGLEKVSQELEEELLTSQKSYALLILDIDYFKKINDEYGHLKGDEILTNIASLLSRRIHSKDILGRWGGEEFVIFTVKEGRDEVLAYANRLREAVQSRSLCEVDITVSIGIGYSHDGHNILDTFHLADKHLYLAKEKGRNTVIDGVMDTSVECRENVKVFF